MQPDLPYLTEATQDILGEVDAAVAMIRPWIRSRTGQIVRTTPCRRPGRNLKKQALRRPTHDNGVPVGCLKKPFSRGELASLLEGLMQEQASLFAFLQRTRLPQYSLY